MSQLVNPKLVAAVECDFDMKVSSGCEYYFILEGQNMIVKDIAGGYHIYTRMNNIEDETFLKKLKLLLPASDHYDEKNERKKLRKVLTTGKCLGISPYHNNIYSEDPYYGNYKDPESAYVFRKFKEREKILKKIGELNYAKKMKTQYRDEIYSKLCSLKTRYKALKAGRTLAAENRLNYEKWSYEFDAITTELKKLNKKVFTKDITLPHLDDSPIIVRHKNSWNWSPNPLEFDYSATPKRRGRKIRKCSIKNPDLVSAIIKSEIDFYEQEIKPAKEKKSFKLLNDFYDYQYISTALDFDATNYKPTIKGEFDNINYVNVSDFPCYYDRDLEESEIPKRYIEKSNKYLETILYKPFISTYEKYIIVPIGVMANKIARVASSNGCYIIRSEDKETYIRKNIEILKEAAYLTLLEHTTLSRSCYNLENVTVDRNNVLLFKFKRKFDFTLIEDDV